VFAGAKIANVLHLALSGNMEVSQGGAEGVLHARERPRFAQLLQAKHRAAQNSKCPPSPAAIVENLLTTAAKKWLTSQNI
jgi:hypothetical protein